MTRQIAVVQNCLAIFGVGETLEAAIADAREWIDDEGKDATLEDLPSHSNTYGEFYWTYITPALAEHVRKVGGDTVWSELEDGTLCTKDEA